MYLWASSCSMYTFVRTRSPKDLRLVVLDILLIEVSEVDAVILDLLTIDLFIDSSSMILSFFIDFLLELVEVKNRLNDFRRVSTERLRCCFELDCFVFEDDVDDDDDDDDDDSFLDLLDDDSTPTVGLVDERPRTLADFALRGISFLPLL